MAARAPAAGPPDAAPVTRAAPNVVDDEKSLEAVAVAVTDPSGPVRKKLVIRPLGAEYVVVGDAQGLDE